MSSVKLLDLVRDKIKNLKAYHVENFDCPIKLHANENPFQLPVELQSQFQERLRNFEFNRYPDPETKALKAIIATRLGVPAECLMIGNGSDELIQLIMQIFCDSGDSVAFPDPTFAMYSIIAKGMGLNPQIFPLNENWDFKAEPFLEAAEKCKARIVFFSYPNNPTGNCFSSGEIMKVIENFQGIVVADEAYYDFAKKTFVHSCKTHNNLIILRSLSKIGLAGLRVGYGVADPAVIEQINKVRLPYNSNTVSQTFSEIVLRNFAAVQTQIDRIIEERKRVCVELSKMEFVTPFPSDSNFILFRVRQESSVIFRQLAENGILVRDLSAHPRLKNCLRVTVGTRDENDPFLAKIEELSRAGVF